MNTTKYVNCLNCEVPFSIPPLINDFAFPDDLQPIIDLLEGRFNCAVCRACGFSNAILTTVVVINPAERSVLFNIPEGIPFDGEAELQRNVPDYQLQICHNYGELYRLMLPWLENYIMPISQVLFSQARLSDTAEQLSTREQIELITPLYLRILKGQVDGKIPFHVQVEGSGSLKDANAFLNEFYTSLVVDHLKHILHEAVSTQSILQLLAVVEELIPKECVTPQILSVVASHCLPFTNPYQDPHAYMPGFSREYLNAVIHAHAETVNPRGPIWAMYVFAAWKLSKDDRVTLDPQYLLSPEVIQRILRFEDLWDASLKFYGGLDKRKMDDLLEMMKIYGFEERFAEVLKSTIVLIDKPNDLEVSLNLLKSLQEHILKEVQFNNTVEDSNELGFFVGNFAQTLLFNAFSDDALSLIYEMLQQAISQDDRIAAISIVAHSIKSLNDFELYHEAYELLGQVVDLADDKLIFSIPRLTINFWNEVGNVYRYNGYYQEALKTYDFVAKLAEVAPRGEVGDNTLAAVNKNRAIVYREMGHFSKAIDMLQQELTGAPRDHTLLHSLAVLYLMVNRYEKALLYMNQAIELVQGGMYRDIRANYLITRGWIKQLLGLPENGLQDLIEAFNITPEEALTRRSRIASAAMDFYSQTEDGERFIERCKRLLVDSISVQAYRQSSNIHITTLTSLGMRLLKDGEVQATKELVEPEWERVQQNNINTPWQFHYLMGQLYYTLGEYSRCWPFIRTALAELDKDVPTAQEIDLAPFWMHDKEAFQSSLATISLDLVGRGILPGEELLAVYEFMNGKEISARLALEVSSDLAASVMFDLYKQRIYETGRHIETFFFVDTQESIKLVHVSALKGTVTIIDDLSAQEITNIKKRLGEAFKRANPVDLLSLDRKLQLWEKLSRRIGAKIMPYLGKNHHICFLPGRAFTGFPLHLIRMPNEAYLIDHHTVTYAPNFTLLLTREKSHNASLDKMTIVVVTKENDDVSFRQLALKGAEQLRDTFEKERPSILLREQEADYTSVIEALGTSSEVVFICHGTTAGQEKGYGICIAHEGHLPPSLLPVIEVPELSQFILTWQDIATLKQTSRIVVSMACSTGITEVASGGVRFGLEQTLFSGGTRVIISPLWDVEQLSSLTWIEHFYMGRTLHPGWSVDQAFQYACLELRKQYPHPYFWGPFIFNGSLLQEEL